jgi:hypothetical protein
MFKFYQNMVGTLKICLNQNNKRIFFYEPERSKKFCRNSELRSGLFRALTILIDYSYTLNYCRVLINALVSAGKYNKTDKDLIKIT